VTVAVRCHACGWTGDAIGLVAIVRGLDVRRDWARIVEEISHLTNGRLDGPPIAERDRRAIATSVTDSGGDDAYNQIWSYILDASTPLKSVSPSIARYLQSRGIFEDAGAVGLRGMPKDPTALIDALVRNYGRAALVRAGVLRRGTSSVASPCWPLLIPWRDRFGRITCVQRRRVDSGEPRYLSPPGRSPRAPFGVDLLGAALAAGGDDVGVVVVEGAIDTLSRRLIARHRRESVAVIGVYSASTPCVGLPLDLLSRRRIVLALDADDAGERACAAIAKSLDGVVANVTRERPPSGANDWNATITELSK
jgi:DNA primase